MGCTATFSVRLLTSVLPIHERVPKVIRHQKHVQSFSRVVQFISVKNTSGLPFLLLSLLCLSCFFFCLLVNRHKLPPCRQGSEQYDKDPALAPHQGLKQLSPEKLHDEGEVIVSPSNVLNPPLCPATMIIDHEQVILCKQIHLIILTFYSPHQQASFQF